MRTLVLAASIAALLSVDAALASAATAAKLVVDDDGAQCANADFTRSGLMPAPIQAAIQAARPRDLITVCPGSYAESVTVDKPLTMRAQPTAVDGIDCLQSTPPELSTDQYAIVDPSDDTAVAFDLAANDVELSGFVIQGGSIGIATSDNYAGYRVHHNLIRSNRSFAAADGSARGGYSIEFGSGGPNKSRVDRNCSRENVSLAAFEDGASLPSRTSSTPGSITTCHTGSMPRSRWRARRSTAGCQLTTTRR